MLNRMRKRASERLDDQSLLQTCHVRSIELLKRNLAEGGILAATTGVQTLADHQPPNGQIAKFVDLHRQEADFWYLGFIDSTLWWLIALAILDRRKQPQGLLRRYSRRIKLAIQWLLAQEHQRC